MVGAEAGKWGTVHVALLVRVDAVGMERVVRVGGSVMVARWLHLREGDRVQRHGPGRGPVMGGLKDVEAAPLAVCSFRGGEVYPSAAQEGGVWMHRIVMMTV